MLWVSRVPQCGCIVVAVQQETETGEPSPLLGEEQAGREILPIAVVESPAMATNATYFSSARSIIVAKARRVKTRRVE
jgi:hypothetical protein